MSLKNKTFAILLSCALASTPTAALASREANHPAPLSADALPAIMERLKGTNTAELMKALDELQRIQPINSAASAVPAIIRITSLPTPANDWQFPYLQISALRALGALPLTKESIDVLFHAASSANKDIAYNAIQNLPVDDEYLPRIQPLIANFSPQQKMALIGRFSSPPVLSAAQVAFLQLFLTESDPLVLTNLGQILTSKGKHHPEFASGITAAIKRQAENTGTQGSLFFLCSALATTGGAPREELPLFITLLSEGKDDGIRYYSAQIIGSFAEHAVPAVPALLRTVTQDKSELARGYAVQALGNIGPAAREAIPTLITILTEKTVANYRYMAAEALGKIITPQDTQAIQALLSVANDNEAETQKQVLLALQRKDLASPEIAEALKKLTVTENSPNKALYVQTLSTLGIASNAHIAPAASQEEMIAAWLADPDEKVKQKGLLLLSKQKSIPDKFIPLLIESLDAKDTLNRWYAMNALQVAGPPAKDALPHLLAILQHEPNGSGFVYVCNTLASIGPENKDVLTALRDRMLQGETFVADAPALALAKTGENGIPYLLEGLHSNNLYTIYVAAKAFAATTGNAKPVVPELLSILKTPQKLGVFTTAGFTTSGAIIAALKHIDPDAPEVRAAIAEAEKLPAPTHR